MTMRDRFQAKPVLGGLNTKLPPTMMDQQFSPDLLNVVVRDGVTRKRGGLTPMFLDRMRGDAIHAPSWRTTASISTGSGADGPFVVAPGCAIAGHRDVYNQGDASVALSIWFDLKRLTPLQGGTNGPNSGATLGVYNPTPFTVRIQPIISKGPFRKSLDYISSWTSTPDEAWGVAADSGMPFCVYIWNSGTGTAPVWSFRLSAHVQIGGTWTLQTVVSSQPVVEGGRYHILAQVTPTRVALRIARLHGDVTSGYVEDETTFAAGTIGRNLCPIMVFDCPQQFVDTAAVGSATQRPGLGLTFADGGYFFGGLRPEGSFDQVAIWVSDPELPDLEDLERRARLPYLGQPGLASLWSMGGNSLDYVKEETGRGNHLFLVPRGPVSVPDDGGKEGGSWFYNGATSYTLLDTETPNWREYDLSPSGPKAAAMWALVRDNMPHGLHCEFWVDSVETTLGQVVAEIHSVLRLEIAPSGQLRGYCRYGEVSVTATTLGQKGGLYSGPVLSTTVVQPGRRYAVALVRRDGGAALDIYVNGYLEATAVVPPSNYDTDPLFGNSFPPCGVTLGNGSYDRLLAPASVALLPSSNQVNTHQGTGFIGRIETFRIITTPNAASLVTKAGPEDVEDWTTAENRIWAQFGPLSPSINPGYSDTVQQAGRGLVILMATQEQDGQRVSQVTRLPSGGYALAEAPMPYDLPRQLGNEALQGVGARAYHTLCYYRFNIEDRDIEYPGAYTPGFERRSVSGTTVKNIGKSTHVQQSRVVDQAGLIGGCWRCCTESDYITDDPTYQYWTILTAEYQGTTHRQRPYRFRSPAEIGPQWVPGLIGSSDNSVPVTMLADFDTQIEARRLMFAACGRQLYWAKPAWDRGFLWFAGGDRSYAGGPVNPANPLEIVDPGDTLVISMWVKPQRMDGQRMLAAKRTCDPVRVQQGLDFLFNWCIYTDNGSINVVGVMGGTEYWRFAEGSIAAGATDVSQTNSLKVGVWNNVHVTIVVGSPGSVTVRVNGEMVPMADCNLLTGSKRSDPFASAPTVSPEDRLWIGGFPEGFARTALPSAAGDPFEIDMASWHGLVSDFSVRTTIDTDRWGSDDGFPLPMGQRDPGSVYWLPMTEGEGWLLSNAVDIGWNLDVSIQEFVGIHGGMRSEDNRYYKYVAFRDRLIVTNGSARPTSIQFLGFDTAAPFRVRTVGVDAPVANDIVLQTTTTLGSAITDGLYGISATFVTEDGLESEATLLALREMTGGPFGSIRFAIVNLPRSPDPQVVRRRIYVSGNGGGDPIFNREVLDNESYTIDMLVEDAAQGVTPPAGTNLPAPRARHIAIAGSSLVLADLPDVPAGQNAFAFSRTDEVSLFTLQGLAIILDSEDGKPITAIGHNLGQAFFAKRNSIHMLAVGAIVTALSVEAQVRLVQASDGIGGGIAPASNLLYGCGDRGVFVFNNTEINYLSDAVEPTWRTQVDRGEVGDGLGLYLMTGAFLRPFSQYWVSVRRRGQPWKDTLLCLDLATGSWTEHRVMPHSLMSILEAAVSNPVIAVGTMNGRVLKMDDDMLIDGASAEPNSLGAVTLQGSAGLSGTATSLTMAGANFPATLAGLEGVYVTLVYNGGTVQRTIEWNDSGSFTWSEPLPGFVSFTSFVIGAYPGYWTSPWITKGAIGQPQELKRLAVETIPQQGTLQVDVASVQRLVQPQQAWPTDAGAIEGFQFDMLQGFERPLLPREQKDGIYHRFRFGTYGILDPFALVGYTPEIEVSRSRDVTGRRS